MTKEAPCCARKTGCVTREEANLRTVIRKAGSQPHRWKTFWEPRVATAKATLAQARQAVIDHEADHADAH